MVNFKQYDCFARIKMAEIDEIALLKQSD